MGASLASTPAVASDREAALAAHSPSGELLQFAIAEPGVENHFYRRGTVAAHLLASSGKSPRLIVAFPAGNTGIALWFGTHGTPAQLGLAKGTQVEGIERGDGMRGVTAHLHSDANHLELDTAILANIRTLRNYITSKDKVLAPEMVSQVTRGTSVVFHRTTVDGKHHMELRIVPERGTTLVTRNGKSELIAGANRGIHAVVTALADDTPLTPFAMADLLTGAAANRPRDKHALAFLASAENFSAGSWRFLNYFGRDTLLSTKMLMPVLRPGAIEAAVGSVLERLSPQGIVAHEESIGEYAALENMRFAKAPANLLTPVRDYKMIDGDFLLAPVLASYLLDSPEGMARAKAFLERKTSTGQRYDEQIRTNLNLVLRLAAPFAADPKVANLISLRDGVTVGNWRDSGKGLGGGRYAFDVNVALVPAALSAAERLYRSGLLGKTPELAATAGQYASAWKDTESYFRITVPTDVAKNQVLDYARGEALDPTAAVNSITAPVRYDAVALDAAGAPIPVMHSDSSFVMLFASPSADYLDSVAGQINRPFPAGLRTAVGIVVANPAYGSAPVQRIFTRKDYHGTVVWSWQQAMLAAGIKRQLARADLPPATLESLRAAEQALWQGILAMQHLSSGELWSWNPQGGKETVAMWDSAEGDEACAAQLWSTVYLAVQPPATTPVHK